MSALSEELKRVGIESSEEAFLRRVVEAVREMPSAGPPLLSPNEFTAAEREALERGGLVLEPFQRHDDDPSARFIASFATMVATSMTPTEVAELLGVDPSRIRQRLGNRTLLGFKVGMEWRIPRFQFDGNRLVPGVERVFPRIEPDMHPVGILRWFTLPDPDLEVDDVAVSPRDWLLSGGNPDAIADLGPGLY